AGMETVSTASSSASMRKRSGFFDFEATRRVSRRLLSRARRASSGVGVTVSGKPFSTVAMGHLLGNEVYPLNEANATNETSEAIRRVVIDATSGQTRHTT